MAMHIYIDMHICIHIDMGMHIYIDMGITYT